MEQQLTHWKKNNDSRYISGEDLKAGLKGLKSEMNVTIERFEDAETFDQSTQKKLVKTGFFLREIGGAELYKPVILNNTNAKFCSKEFGSEFMEHWIGKPLTLYAMPDKRFGHVARFRKYFAPQVSDDSAEVAHLSAATNLDDLKLRWSQIPPERQAIPTVAALLDKLKSTLK